MNEPNTWVVYKRLGIDSIYGESVRVEEQTFSSLAEAESFLAAPIHKWPSPARKENGWQEAVPIVDLSSESARFLGPTVSERLWFSNVERSETWEGFVDEIWEDNAIDLIPAVMDQMEQEGAIPSSPDPWGPPVLTRDHQTLIDQRLREHQLPSIRCCLSDEWDFFRIRSDARRRIGHVNPDPSAAFSARLCAAAIDLEAALGKKHPQLSKTDVYHFWTSLQVHVHLADFCRTQVLKWRLDEGGVEEARRRFCRSLGSYAHELESSTAAPPGTSDPGHNVVRLRIRRQPHPDPESLLGRRQHQRFDTVADVLGTSKRTISKLVEAGSLDAIGKGPGRMITTESLKRHLRLADRKVEQSSKTKPKAE